MNAAPTRNALRTLSRALGTCTTHVSHIELCQVAHILDDLRDGEISALNARRGMKRSIGYISESHPSLVALSQAVSEICD